MSRLFKFAQEGDVEDIKKDKALSNICTSQALLANYSVLYAMFLGREQLKENAFWKCPSCMAGKSNNRW